MKNYTVNEIFWSPQGEGIRAGEMSVFLRFTGCNLLCKKEAGPKSIGGFDCDTEFESGRRMTLEQLIAEVRSCVPVKDEWFTKNKAWVVLTGGEPALQADSGLISSLHSANFLVAIETNGSVDVSGRGIDWVTVSPKVAEHAVRQMTASEVKYVRGYGQGIPIPTCEATYKLLSPAFNGLSIDRKSLDWCVTLIKENPEWRLSIQMHKAWNVR